MPPNRARGKDPQNPGPRSAVAPRGHRPLRAAIVERCRARHKALECGQIGGGTVWVSGDLARRTPWAGLRPRRAGPCVRSRCRRSQVRGSTRLRRWRIPVSSPSGCSPRSEPTATGARTSAAPTTTRPWAGVQSRACRVGGPQSDLEATRPLVGVASTPRRRGAAARPSSRPASSSLSCSPRRALAARARRDGGAMGAEPRPAPGERPTLPRARRSPSSD